MELTPYSLTDNSLEVHLRGLDEAIVLYVSEGVARKTTDALLFPEEDEPDPWIQIELRDRSIVLLDLDHLVLLRHRFDFGVPVGPPPSGHYGQPVTEEFMDEHEWAPPFVALGVEGLGRIELGDQGPDTIHTLVDTVPDGFVFGPFFSVTDDDGELTVIATEHLAFVMLHPEALGR